MSSLPCSSSVHIACEKVLRVKYLSAILSDITTPANRGKALAHVGIAFAICFCVCIIGSRLELSITLTVSLLT